MKQFIFPALFLAMLVTSCTQNRSTQTSSERDSLLTENPGEVISSTENLCYLGMVGRDSVKFEMNRDGNQFNGFLSYNRYQSDSSIGEYSGTISGDTLKGVFDFMSEGVISKTDKYFLMKDGKLLEAIGDLRNVDDYTLVFDNPSALKYGESYVLESIPCQSDFIPAADKKVYYDLQ